MKTSAAVRTIRLSRTTSNIFVATLGLGVVGVVLSPSFAAEPSRPAVAAPAAGAQVDGKELFTREWLPHDPRAHGGDGLGPLFNDSSCVACHNLGGVGGGGPKGKNVRIRTILGTSFVLHHGGTDVWKSLVQDANYLPAEVKEKLKGRLSSGFELGKGTITQRNATALFGAGKIAAIPDRVLEAAAREAFDDFPRAVAGRLSVTEDGEYGRFGWKAQTASLDEFVLTACAVELGLQVPGRNQAGFPVKTGYKAPGLDLNQRECDALTTFIRDLPPPEERRPKDTAAAKYVGEGRELFASVGCAACHRPQLGDVQGIYSDLLLHDMGQDLADPASSYGLLPSQPSNSNGDRGEGIARVREPKRAPNPATENEWRTPPLWGVRDSAPYLHDGRAETLEAAILAHGGQAKRSRDNFDALTIVDKQKVVAFLKSLVAPGS